MMGAGIGHMASDSVSDPDKDLAVVNDEINRAVPDPSTPMEPVVGDIHHSGNHSGSLHPSPAAPAANMGHRNVVPSLPLPNNHRAPVLNLRSEYREDSPSLFVSEDESQSAYTLESPVNMRSRRRAPSLTTAINDLSTKNLDAAQWKAEVARLRRNAMSREYKRRKREQQRAAQLMSQDQTRMANPGVTPGTMSMHSLNPQAPEFPNNRGLDVLQPRQRLSPEPSSRFVRLSPVHKRRYRSRQAPGQRRVDGLPEIGFTRPQFSKKQLPDNFIWPGNHSAEDVDSCSQSSVDDREPELIYHYRVETRIQRPPQVRPLLPAQEMEVTGPFLTLAEANKQAMRMISKYGNPSEKQGGQWQIGTEGMVTFSLEAGGLYVDARVTRKIAGKTRLLSGAATLERHMWMVSMRTEMLDVNKEALATASASGDTHTSETEKDMGKTLTIFTDAQASVSVKDTDAADPSSTSDPGIQQPGNSEEAAAINPNQAAPPISPSTFTQTHLGAYTDLGLANQRASNEWLSIRRSYMADTEHNREVEFAIMETEAREELMMLEDMVREDWANGWFWKQRIFGDEGEGKDAEGGAGNGDSDGASGKGFEGTGMLKKVTVWVEEMRLEGPRN